MADQSAFVEGSVVRLKLKNFRTYDNIEFYPEPGLNVITGVNGAGKSSILYGIGLGLGGKPSTVGRYNEICEFVKYGHEAGSIEIELYDPSRDTNLIIFREINVNNISAWKINGKPTALKMVEKEVRRFNIQINNLCQYLPQDKVSDFSRMNAKELLECTEQAVGDQSMYDDHMNLKKYRFQHCELFKNLSNQRIHLSNNEEKNKRSEADLQLQKEREKHLERIDHLRKKIPWVKYKKMREDFVNMKNERKAVSCKVKDAKSELEPYKEELKQLAEKVICHEKNVVSLDKSLQKVKDGTLDLFKRIDYCSSKISDALFYFQDKEQEESSRHTQLKQLKGIIDSWEIELEDLKNTEKDAEKHLVAIAEKSKCFQYSLLESRNLKDDSLARKNDLGHKLRGLNDSLKKLLDEKSIRLNFLKIKEIDVYEAVLWLRKNQSLFKKEIHEPIMTVVNVSDPGYIKYIESVIAYQDLIAFVAEDPDDMNQFLRILSDERGLNISGVLGTNDSAARQSVLSAEGLRSLGLDCFLKDLIAAPVPVMNFLCMKYELHRIPLAFEYNREKLHILLEKRNLPFSKFYFGDLMYKIKISKYGEHSRTVASQRIKKRNILHYSSIDGTETEELELKAKEIENQILEEDRTYKSHLQAENKFSVQLEEMRNQKQKYSKVKLIKQNTKAKMENKRHTIEVLISQMVDLNEEKNKLSSRMSSESRKKISLSEDVCDSIKKIREFETKKSDEINHHYFWQKEKSKREKAIEDSLSSVKYLEDKLQELLQEERRIKDSCFQLLSQAKRAAGIDPRAEIPQNFVDDFHDTPDSLEGLEIEISKEQAKLDCISETDPIVIQEHKEREKNIRETKEAIFEKEQQLGDLEEKINEIKNNWLPKIDDLVKKISEKFSEHFCNMGCAGEVSLDKTENPDDFDKYGISIRVAYRNNVGLFPLSSKYHSGGECSVATMVFLLSLQEVAIIPFRCVDEINQGMDVSNERDIFNLIMKSSCSPKSSQCFLITPKLLNNLEYAEENMQICITYSGAVSVSDFRLDQFLQDYEDQL